MSLSTGPTTTALMTPLVLSFLFSLAATVAGTRLVLTWLRRRRVFDLPNERSSHSQPTPRGGGLAVTPVILAVWTALAAFGAAQAAAWPVIAAAGGLLLVSWFDDRGGVAARWRLAAHILAAGAGLVWLPAHQLLCQGLLPLWADRLVGLTLWVWFINLFNFMDGIDGISGVEAAMVGLGLVLVAWRFDGGDGAAAAAAVAAAGLGFLVWNWHPAKLFLGDSGSVPLGYLLGWLLLDAALKGHWAAALILPLYYLADATLTLLRRLGRGESPFQAHRQHFYQQAVHGGASHARVAGVVFAVDVPLVALAVAAGVHPVSALIAAALAVALVLAGFARLGRRAGP
jgi:UDP-N-acetylmuramyl pentapeptide phosphotransferase/UDP-N-acetylglucosamine-1-phosphate transferase